MKIEIDEPEIITAILDYVGSQGFTIDNERAAVELKAGRGENGMTATVSMSQGKVEVSVDKKVAEIPIPPQELKETIQPKDSKKLKFGNEK